MRAIQIQAAGAKPTVTEIPAPTEVAADQVRVHVAASALSNLAKRVAMGAHYSADDVYPKPLVSMVWEPWMMGHMSILTIH
ncbi:Uncharacterised protein [Weissella viridescens]|uniref:Uncharacterized protein n=1 Tax=Weissella viridescens TaxID=1629 RepID=A0A380P717_WEIVI|nr:Uncharacterised protein [Weissella viridescens]